MLGRRLSLLLLALLVVGCSRHSARGVQKKPPPPPYSAAVTAPNRPVAAATAPADDLRLVPPKPPGGGLAVELPEPPKSPVVPAAAAESFAPPVVQPPPAKAAGAKPPTAEQVQNLARLKAVYQLAADKWAAVDTFEAKLTRREVVGDREAKTEEQLYQFRKEPMSVYIRNLGEVGKGREVLFVKGKFGDKIQILTGAGDGFSGLKVTKSPDDPMVKSRSRHDIRDSGFGPRIAAFKVMLDKMEAGKVPPDAVKALGPVKRPEYPYPLEGVSFVIAPGDDKNMPKGGVREAFFDPKPESPSYGLPVVSAVFDPGGKEVEYARFESFRLPANLTDADFTPDRFGKK